MGKEMKNGFSGGVRKQIDLTDDIRWKIERLAMNEKKKLKPYIEEVLNRLANGEVLTKRKSNGLES